MMLSIVIVNYKTPTLTLRCLESIYTSISSISFEVIVVDNDSKDNSEELINYRYPKLKWISNKENLGFGAANNIGVKNSVGKYVLLLNSDMLLLQNQKIENCIQLLENNESIGVLGCKLLNEDKSLQKSVYYDVASSRSILKDNILWYKFFKPKPLSLDAVMGSFMLFRKKNFEDINGFDEDFFMYAEELELCNRIQKTGKEIVYFEDYIAIHKHGGSSDGSNWSLCQNMLSNALLFLKIKGWKGYLNYHLLFHVNIIINLVFFYTLNKEGKKSYWNLYKAYFSNYGSYFWIPFYYSFKKNRKKLKFEND